MAGELVTIRINELVQASAAPADSELIILDDLLTKRITKANFLSEVDSRLTVIEEGSYITEEQFDNALENKADLIHIHSQYATLTYVDTQLAQKAELFHTHGEYVTIDALSLALEGKSDVGHTHNINDIDMTHGTIDCGGFV